ncbi:sensor histidine kinase [Bradyrhizobium iriomotense]|uniref:sensor histidine kinase n=1 Tax=Bradyrhizobium iriomotense TaxID=441950 RepID=UPI001FF02B6A|nr:ATP-binding protein [Bradyrhizobium iriomotense]
MTSESFEILDHVEQAVFVRDFDGRIRAWNKASQSLYGYSRDAAIGQLADALLDSVYPISSCDIEASCLATGRWQGEVKRRSARGNQMLVHVWLSVERDLAGTPIHIVETGSEAKATSFEQELRLSEARYRSLFQAMAVSFWELDFSEANKRLRALRNSGVSDFRKYFFENPRVVSEMMTAARVVDVNEHTVLLFGRGNKEELLGNLKPFWPDESTNAFAEAMLSGIAQKPHYWTECKLRRIDGGTFDALFTIAYPPHLSGWTSMVAVIDITERNRAQEMLQRVQSDFAHAARVSMLGELTASITHEVNQPLAAIAANADAGLRWLETAQPEIDRARESIRWIMEDAHRAANVTARIRSMAAHRPPERNLISLDEIIREALLFIRYELQARSVTAVHNASAEPAIVLADRTQLQQVIVNLAINAAQALAQRDCSRRKITIQTIVADDKITCIVEDSGPGIHPDHFAHLFDSFFTTKQEGMGMGLPICRSIVEAHSGHIRAENVDLSGGARFSFTLLFRTGSHALHRIPLRDD